MTMAGTLKRHLDQNGIAYEVITHPATGCSSETAQAAHVSGNRIAKAVVLADNGGYLLAVLPASHHVRLEWIEQAIGRRVKLASEAEASRLFPDCDVGAIPPAGEAYGLDVVMHEGLADLAEVYFEGGDHRSLIRVGGQVFARLMASARGAPISASDAPPL